MLGEAFAFPLGLLRKHTGLFAFAWMLQVVLVMAVDIGAASLGHDVFSIFSNPYEPAGRLPYALYCVAVSITDALPSSLLLVAALRELSERQRAWGLRDVLIVAELNVFYVILVFMPVSGIGFLIADAFKPADPELAYYWPTLIWVLWYVVLAVVAVRLAFMWPLSLASGRVSLREGWFMAQGKGLAIAVTIVPVFLLSDAFEWLSVWSWSSFHYAEEVVSLEIALRPDVLLDMAVFAAIGATSATFYNLVNAYVFHRLRTPRPDAMADIF